LTNLDLFDQMKLSKMDGHMDDGVSIIWEYDFP
jgi:hypothetical protein